MASIEQIRAMNKEATEEAEEQVLTPYIAKCNGDEGVKGCVRLGDYIPFGWELVNTYFVDNLGFGASDEPALTFSQFLTKVKKGFGYAIGEVGQFQVYIHEYKKFKGLA